MDSISWRVHPQSCCIDAGRLLLLHNRSSIFQSWMLQQRQDPSAASHLSLGPPHRRWETLLKMEFQFSPRLPPSAAAAAASRLSTAFLHQFVYRALPPPLRTTRCTERIGRGGISHDKEGMQNGIPNLIISPHAHRQLLCLNLSLQINTKKPPKKHKVDVHVDATLVLSALNCPGQLHVCTSTYGSKNVLTMFTVCIPNCRRTPLTFRSGTGAGRKVEKKTNLSTPSLCNESAPFSKINARDINLIRVRAPDALCHRSAVNDELLTVCTRRLFKYEIVA